MKNIEISLTNKLKEIINQIIFAVGDLSLSQTSIVFKAAVEAKKILDINENKPEYIELYSYPKYKWTQYGMLEHCLAVINLILRLNKSFPEACALRAREARKTIPSIRQACCRSLSLITEDWNKMAKGDQKAKNLIIDKLLNKYPSEHEPIKSAFNSTNKA